MESYVKSVGSKVEALEETQRRWEKDTASYLKYVDSQSISAVQNVQTKPLPQGFAFGTKV